MKIVFIASASSIHTIRWVKYFTNKNNNIYLLSLTRPNHETSSDFNQIEHDVKTYYLDNLEEIIKAIRLISKLKNAIIHIHYLGWHSLLSFFISRNSKIIITPWGSDILYIDIFKKIWFKILMKKASYLICDSKRLVKKSIELGMDKNKIFISMFGVDTDIYKSKRNIFSDKEIIRVGTNRKLESIYDVITFIKAAKLICQKRNDIYFYVAGNGTMKEKLQNYVRKNKIDKNIKFLGLIDSKEMIDFYNNIDLYISTSLSDGGLAASIAEAMSFKRLVIVSDNSDNKIWIKNKINGFLFKTKDYKDLSKNILKAIENKENAIELSKKARNKIIKEYSYKKEMQKVLEKYEDLIKNNI